MFGRRSTPEPTPVESTPAGPTSGKGHATPSRREAEEARRQQLRIPKDPKEAKRAARERDRAERERQRQGMAAGDPRYLPARDQGPARAFARDFVDSRISLAEFFVFIAVAVLLIGLVQPNNNALQFWVSTAFFVFTLATAVDVAITLVRLNLQVRKLFPEPKDRRGVVLYAALRTLQLRKLRLPAPRVKRGGQPKD